ncbi:extracellular solute-binding protein [Paenibacillus aurantius]|uniref:Extracellular solute-binding protein n=1 Tax=Paenibacillus aurantius TaxID=2918900 RepID=A0AA96RH70_9BACL|nr:extracellular solute-binding protein [Paenibacillus aurantius]WNQ13241.1 extracellular solute-binding protein [Paenibacillus aurantius]
MKKQAASVMGGVMLATAVLSACSSGSEGQAGAGGSSKPGEDTKPFALSIVANQVGEIPPKGNPLEQALAKYTNTTPEFQWIPASAYDDKVNVMMASGELPKLIKVNYVPTIINAMKSDQFWEIGPYLKDYKNLSAQPSSYFDNIKVEGKLYGIPIFRDIGRAVVHYRKDWFDAAGLKVPKSLDDWYNVLKAVAESDPDKNGKKDTYGFLLDKAYNQGTASTLTRLSVAQGGPNKWKVDDQGTFTPEFMTEEFFATMKLFKRLYDEKLINQDFSVVDAATNDKSYEAGRVALRISGGNAQSMQTNLVKVVPTAVVDAAPLEGPSGIRVPGESGNAGIWAIPKSSVKTEAEMKKVLSFLDKLLDKEMVYLINKGVEGKHYKVEGDFTIPLDKDADAKEVKPYRDTLIQRGEAYNMDKPMKETDLFLKNKKLVSGNEKYAVNNPALTLLSDTYTERGKELEQMITDAETKFIMGKIDEAGWKAEMDKWKKAGGDKLMQEYKEAYLKNKK